MWIRILVTIFSLFAIVRIVHNYRTSRLSGTASFFWSLIWLAVGIVFWSPDIASRLALSVGIGRGADLVTYSAIIVLVYLVYRVFIRLERVEHALTQLTRAVTLRDVSDKKNSPDTDRQL